MLLIILHVEASDDIRFIVDVVLAQFNNLTLLQCASASEAVEKATAFEPQMLLLDGKHADECGDAHRAQLQQQVACKDLPVVYLTSRLEPRIIEKMYSEGVLGIIPKPFDPLLLPDQLEDLWRQYCRSVTPVLGTSRQ